MKSTVWASALLATLMVSTASAQPINVSGKIVATTTSPCALVATHKLDCTDVYLRTGALSVNLAALEGQYMKLTGTLESCGNVVTVLSATPASPKLTYSKSLFPANLGCPIEMGLFHHQVPANYLVLASPLKGVYRVNMQQGTFLLDPNNFVFLLSGVIPGGPGTTISMFVPNLPTLTGLNVYFQAAAASTSPGSLWVLSNATCFTIGALGPCGSVSG